MVRWATQIVTETGRSYISGGNHHSDIALGYSQKMRVK